MMMMMMVQGLLMIMEGFSLSALGKVVSFDLVTPLTSYLTFSIDSTSSSTVESMQLELPIYRLNQNQTLDVCMGDLGVVLCTKMHHSVSRN